MAAWLGRTGDDRFTGEQAALRQVATLVARGAPPEEVFAAVTEEAGRLLGASFMSMARYDPDGARTVVASWSNTGASFPVGARAMLGGRNVATLVSRTGRAARIDDYADATGPVADAVREHAFCAAVGVPVSVEGRIWGLMIADSRVEPLPVGTEARLAEFTELAATAIANAQARVELRGFAEEQAALRRVAVLVARAARPEEVFAVVTEEAGRLLHADHATMSRNDPAGARTVVAAWDSTGLAFPVGTRWSLGGHNLQSIVSQTGRPARIDNYADASGPVADAVRELGTRAAVGVPVSVEGRLWGTLMVGSRSGPLPVGTEVRLAGFTELAAIAIANAEAQADLVRAESERRALETELQRAERLQTVGQLTSSIAHDFGNLLAVIVGYAQMAEDVTDDRDPELHRILGDIRGAADRAVHLSGDLLGFSRRVRAKTERLDLNSLISGMMDLLLMSMSGRGEVISELSPILPPVQADPGQLEQVLLNLAVNARDAMPEGGTLTIRTSTADLSADISGPYPGAKHGRYVELAVQDTGIGMTADVRKRVFERFFTTKPGTGTGLGLSTVHGIITGAGGTIEADSLEGRGTTFRIYLPAAPGQPGLVLEAPPLSLDAGGLVMAEGLEVALEFEGPFCVLVHLVIAQPAPCEPAPDDVAVGVDPSTARVVRPVMAPQCDRHSPRRPTDHDLVALMLDTRRHHLRQPGCDQITAAHVRRPPAGSREPEVDVGRFHAQGRTRVAGVQSAHVPGEQPNGQPVPDHRSTSSTRLIALASKLPLWDQRLGSGSSERVPNCSAGRATWLRA